MFVPKRCSTVRNVLLHYSFIAGDHLHYCPVLRIEKFTKALLLETSCCIKRKTFTAIRASTVEKGTTWICLFTHFLLRRKCYRIFEIIFDIFYTKNICWCCVFANLKNYFFVRKQKVSFRATWFNFAKQLCECLASLPFSVMIYEYQQKLMVIIKITLA